MPTAAALPIRLRARLRAALRVAAAAGLALAAPAGAQTADPLTDQTAQKTPAGQASFAGTGPLPDAPAPDAGRQARLGLVVDASNPERLVDILRGMGLRAELDTSASPPLILGQIEGANFAILFYGCGLAQSCAAIQFVAGFQMADPPGLQRLNEWNAGRILGQAYLDEDGILRIAHYMALRHGVSETNFTFAVQQWGIAVRDFMTHIGFR